MAAEDYGVSQLKDLTVLVIGSSGYIAGHIVQQLLETGATVRGTVRKIGPQYDYLRAMDKSGGKKLKFCEADLTKDDGWLKAVAGADIVIHTANPMPGTMVKDPKTGKERCPETEEEFLRPSIDGMNRILRACHKADSVKRLVVTSSIGAMNWERWDDPESAGKVLFSTGDDWTPLREDIYVSPYARGKSIAEKNAFNYPVRHPDCGFDVTSIIPAWVLGPWLGPKAADSVQMALLDFLEGNQPPVVLPVQNAMVDVREVATAHVRACTVKKAAGRRYLLGGECLWYNDIMRLINDQFNDRGISAPTYEVPLFVVDLLAIVDINARNFVQSMAGSKRMVDNTPSQHDLGIVYRPSQETIIDTVERAYFGPGGDQRKRGGDWVAPLVSAGKAASVGGLGYFAYKSGLIDDIVESVKSTFSRE
jgi:nucleoside-diphosphate-sugar epimerase